MRFHNHDAHVAARGDMPRRYDGGMSYGDGPFFDALCRELDLPDDCKLIRSNTNLIYDCGPTYLRLTPNAYRSRPEVVKELRWLQFVQRHTDDVVQVVGDGDALTNQFTFDGESFTVTRFERIDGEPITRERWDDQHFEQVGELTGFLHRIAQDYKPAVDVALSHWDEVPEACLAEHLPDDGRGLRQLNQTVFDHMAAMPRAAEQYGPIHYDIHAGNYLMTRNGRMVLLDFENSCRGHNINDIAVACYYARLHDFAGDDDDFDPRFLRAFRQGYERQYAWPTDDQDGLPWLVLNRSLIVYGYLFKIWPSELSVEQAAFVERVEQSVERARAKLGL